MTPYLITPLAPLIFRGGKPFGAGSRDGDNDPLPSAIAGALRAQWIDQQAFSSADHKQASIQEALQFATAGPLLVHENAQGHFTPWVPAPADAVYLPPLSESAAPSGFSAYRIQPQDWPNREGLPACGTDLPPGLLPLQPAGEQPQSKALPGPRWWPLAQLREWRSENPAQMQCQTLPDAPALDLRTHVAIDPATRAAATGKLFQTEGRDYGHQTGTSGRWHLLAFFNAQAALPKSTITLGGERRLSALQAWPVAGHEKSPPNPIAQPDDLRKNLSALAPGQWLSLTLATPALFAQGWRPGWLGENLEGAPPGHPGLRLKLRAAAVPRWQAISGWDLKKHQPKATRRAVPAGAVYWFEVVSESPVDASALWLTPLSDNAQDRLDGFGLAFPALCPPAR